MTNTEAVRRIQAYEARQREMHAIGNICDLFDPDECWNFLKAAGYASD